MSQVCRDLTRLAEVETTADLTIDRMGRWIAGRSSEVGPNTVLGEAGYIRALCEFAREEGLIERNPWDSRRLKLRPGPKLGKSHHDWSDVSRVLDGLAAEATSWRARRLYALCATAAYTGARKNELLYLQLSDVDLGLRVLYLGVRRRLKTDASARPAPVPPDLAEILGRWMPHAGLTWLFPGERGKGPWTGGMPGSKPLDVLKAAGERFGVEGLTFQSLRHSYGTHAESRWGLSVATIQRVLGHSTVFTMEHYRHADKRNLARAVEGVSYRLDPPAEAAPSPRIAG